MDADPLPNISIMPLIAYNEKGIHFNSKNEFICNEMQKIKKKK
jgi:hypothetical protein